MSDRRRKAPRLGTVSFLLAICTGAVAGYMTSVRAGRPRISMVTAGALLGSFVGIILLLRSLQLSTATKRIAGSVTGITIAIICGVILSWAVPSIVIVAIVGGVLGYFGDKWATSITF